MGRISDEPVSALDFWEAKELKNIDYGLRYVGNSEMGFQLTTWIRQFYRFVNYMSEFIIPIYQWYFIGMLLESIENVYGEDTYEKEVTKEERHRDHLLKALELLATYIENHAVDLIRPISNIKGDTPFVTENLSVLMKHRYEKCYNLPEEVIEEIAKNFLVPDDKEDIELNLKPINPEFFRRKDNLEDWERPNYPKIHRFYIELVKESYLNDFGNKKKERPSLNKLRDTKCE